MLSRVASSVYWMTRYIERAENIARFISVNLNLTLDFPSEAGSQWQPIVMTTGDHDLFEKKYGTDYSSRNVIHFLALDPDYGNSILSSLKAARENARSVREIISSEMWEQINRFYIELRDAATTDFPNRNPHKFFKIITMRTHVHRAALFHHVPRRGVPVRPDRPDAGAGGQNLQNPGCEVFHASAKGRGGEQSL